MKKKFLLIASLLLSSLSANAVNWQYINSENPYLNLYIDTDSIINVNENQSYYAIKYNTKENLEKVAFIKADYKDNLIGIIQAGDYEVEKYAPQKVFTNSHVFMKPINENSFLNYVYDYVSTTKPVIANNEQGLLYSDKSSLKETQVSYKTARETLTSKDLDDYVVQTSKILEQNWFPPNSGRGTQTIVIVSIGKDGKLLNIKFKESSGDDLTDLSIINALEKTVPFPKFPQVAKDVFALDFQFVFENDLTSKTVVR